MPELGPFAEKIFKKRYAITPDETWEECTKRVSDFVAGEDHKELADEFFEAIKFRKLMPGGRYLAQAGKEIPMLTNCFLMRAGDSREEWAQLLYQHMLALSLGGGVGTYYGDVRCKGTPIKRFGGTASGPVSLMKMVNEVARHVLAGGRRRAALLSSLPWSHPDIHEFIEAKNWSTQIKALKEVDWNFPADLDMSNLSVVLDDEFFKQVNKDKEVWNLYYKIVKNACKTGEPGLVVATKKDSKNVLRNPCQSDFATVLTPNGIRQFKDIDVGSVIWSSDGWVKVIQKEASGIQQVFSYRTTASTFIGTKEHLIFQKGSKIKIDDAEALDILNGPELLQKNLFSQDIMDGLVLGDGGIHKASNNLVILYIGTNDQEYFSSEIAGLIKQHRPGINEKVYEIETTLTPEDLPHTYNRKIPDRFYYGDTNKKLGFLRGLYSANGYVVGKEYRNRVCLKQTSYNLILQVRDMLSSIGIRSYITTNKSKAIKHINGTYITKTSYGLNISVDRNKFKTLIGFLQKYKNDKIFCKIKQSKKGVEKKTFSIKQKEYLGDFPVYNITVDGPSHSYWTGGSLVSNCGEIISDTHLDSCNLGAINLARIADIDELKRITRLAVRFLYLGTYRGTLPHNDFVAIRKKNRRIGLGLMGLHEWLLQRGERYEPNSELGKWLSCWENISNDEAKKFSKQIGGTKPVAVRTLAPTGTTSIIAETSSGMEPIFCTSYKRQYLHDNSKWETEYVIDPTVKRLVENGVIDSPNDVEDAIKLSTKVERRIRMQAFLQGYIDQAISSTINLPPWGEYGNNNATQFAQTLLEYLPKLKGITVYPDGARPGQPITPIKWDTALKHQPEAKEDEERCAGGICGI